MDWDGALIAKAVQVACLGETNVAGHVGALADTELQHVAVAAEAAHHRAPLSCRHVKGHLRWRDAQPCDVGLTQAFRISRQSNTTTDAHYRGQALG
jgi:hypothetical protein